MFVRHSSSHRKVREPRDDQMMMDADAEMVDSDEEQLDSGDTLPHRHQDSELDGGDDDHLPETELVQVSEVLLAEFDIDKGSSVTCCKTWNGTGVDDYPSKAGHAGVHSFGRSLFARVRRERFLG